MSFDTDVLDEYDWAGRTGRRHRRMVLDHLAIAAFDDNAETSFRRWLADGALPRELRPTALEEEINTRFSELGPDALYLASGHS